jgi:mannobiose 2-epimerase
MNSQIIKELENLKSEAKHESESLLEHWLRYIDITNGGFHCFADHYGNILDDSDKSVLLHCRILWTFSSAYQILGKESYRRAAEHCFDFVKNYALDRNAGGVYHSVSFDGIPIIANKHLYIQSFAIYAFSEFYVATNNEESREFALSLFDLVERKCLDNLHGGYIESFDQNWNPVGNLLLGLFGNNDSAPKTMNTHLHVLEAYTRLWEATSEKSVGERLLSICELTTSHILKPDYTLSTHFDQNWNGLTEICSFGHNMEMSWLFQKATNALSLPRSSIVLPIVNAVLEDGVDSDGAILNERVNHKIENEDRIWWVQAESMVALVNAYELTNQEHYFRAAQKCWTVIMTQLKDHRYGEWHWKVDRLGNEDISDPKIHEWKCPYHNVRACLEVYKRIEALEPCSMLSKNKEEKCTQ